MNRRFFSKLVALGAGSLGMWQAQVRGDYDYITTGSTDEITLHDNVAAFQRLRILPPLLTGVAEADTATSVLKQPIALPILLAPVAGQSLYHPQGALASARAAATAKTIMGVSSSRSLLVS